MSNPSRSPLAHWHDSMLEGSLSISRNAIDAAERFSALHWQTLKVSFEETGEHLGALVGAGDPVTATTVLQAWVAPSGDKFQSWLGHVQNILTETGTKLAKDWEKQVAGNGSSLQATLESAAYRPTAGNQGLFPWMLQAVPDEAGNSSGRSGSDDKAVSGRARSK